MSDETGFSPEQKAGILQREGSFCAMYGRNPKCRRQATTVNHRLNRGAGGTSDRGTGKNGTENGCAICWDCNGAIEDNADLSVEAQRLGVKLRDGDDPTRIPMWCVFFHQWVQLRDDALYLTGITDDTLDAHEIAGELPEVGAV